MTADTNEALDALAYRFWSVSPKDLDVWERTAPRMPEGYPGGVRAWFYACEMRDMLTAQAAKLAEAEAELAQVKADLAEMTRRRDEWRKKGEGFDELAAAVRVGIEEAGERNLSRVFVRGALIAETRRADEAEAALKIARRQALQEAADAVQSVADGLIEARDVAAGGALDAHHAILARIEAEQ